MLCLVYFKRFNVANGKDHPSVACAVNELKERVGISRTFVRTEGVELKNQYGTPQSFSRPLGVFNY